MVVGLSESVVTVCSADEVGVSVGLRELLGAVIVLEDEEAA